MTYRSQTDIVAKILELASDKPISKKRLMYMTYYPYELMQTLTAILAKNDLLDFDKQTHQFHTTLKGQRYLELYEGMQRQCADFSLNEVEMYNNKDYWKNELKSLGIEPKRSNELNDPEELKDLVDRLKQSMYQDYKTAYSNQGKMHKEAAESAVNV